LRSATELAEVLGLSEDDLRDAAYGGAGWWTKRCGVDDAALTELSARLAIDCPDLKIAKVRTHRRAIEETLVSECPDTELRAVLEDHLRTIWVTVPYPGCLEARVEILLALGVPPEAAALASELAETPVLAIRRTELPDSLRRPGDAERVDTLAVAERIDSLEDRTLDALEVAWLPTEYQRVARRCGKAAFLRELCKLGSVGTVLLGAYARAHPARLASPRTLLAGMGLLARLLQVAGLDDGDPLGGLRLDASTVTIGLDAVLDFEAALGRRIELRVATLGPGASDATREAVAKREVTGINLLRDVLDAGRGQGASIAGDPCIEIRFAKGRRRSYGAKPDGYYLEPEMLARFIAETIDELSGPEDRERLKAFLVAICTLCRPKECMPRSEDVAPLGLVHLVIYIDPETGKTGSRELYVAACAVVYFGISAKWFPSRSWVDPNPAELAGVIGPRSRRPAYHHLLPTAETDRARVTLEEACRRARARFEREHGEALSDRLAYLTRKFVSAYLLRARIEPAFALTDVLGHDDMVSDWTYAALEESEIFAMNNVAIDAARERGGAR
jgi:hypothetical protein